MTTNVTEVRLNDSGADHSVLPPAESTRSVYVQTGNIAKGLLVLLNRLWDPPWKPSYETLQFSVYVENKLNANPA